MLKPQVNNTPKTKKAVKQKESNVRAARGGREENYRLAEEEEEEGHVEADISARRTRMPSCPRHPPPWAGPPTAVPL